MKRYGLKHIRAGALLLAVLLAALAFCACSAKGPSAGQKPVADAPAPGGTEQAALESAPVRTGIGDIEDLGADNYPAVDGSTATLPLMAQVYSGVCGVPYGEAETLVAASRTSEAWRRLARGEVDLLLVYEPDAETIAWLNSEGPAMEVSPIGLDGLVFLVNADNPVNSLTADQLRGIYTGAATSWSQLGGADTEIAAFQRNAESGSQALFLKLLMQGAQPVDPPTDKVAMGMGELIDVLSAYDGGAGAIGYSVYYYASEMYENPQLKLLAVDGVPPTGETLADGTYPLTNAFYVAIRADEADGSPARTLRDWLLGPQGAEAVEAAGYVPAGID